MYYVLLSRSLITYLSIYLSHLIDVHHSVVKFPRCREAKLLLKFARRPVIEQVSCEREGERKKREVTDRAKCWAVRGKYGGYFIYLNHYLLLSLVCCLFIYLFKGRSALKLGGTWGAPLQNGGARATPRRPPRNSGTGRCRDGEGMLGKGCMGRGNAVIMARDGGGLCGEEECRVTLGNNVVLVLARNDEEILDVVLSRSWILDFLFFYSFFRFDLFSYTILRSLTYFFLCELPLCIFNGRFSVTALYWSMALCSVTSFLSFCLLCLFLTPFLACWRQAFLF